MNRPKVSLVQNFVFLLLIGAALLLIGLPYVMAGDEVLFLNAPGSVTQQDMGVSQAKRVAINWEVLRDPHIEQIKINLFDGQSVTAVHDQTYPSSAEQGFVWTGHLLEKDNSAVTLSVVDDVLSGSIILRGIEQYTIGYDGQGQVLQEIDPSRALFAEGPDMVTAPAMAAQPNGESDLCEDGSRIDLMVAYTAAARQRKGGTAGMIAWINNRVAQMNTANASSGLSFRYKLVHVMETNYVETGDVGKDLDRLVDSTDNSMVDVIAKRNQHLADMTSLIIGQSTKNNSCGIAYVMRSQSTAFANYAFNVSALDYAGDPTCSPLTMAHEFGHGMGNLHDRAHNSLSPIFDYSFGYQSPNRTFRTIMAYQCAGGYCPQINQWSNPDKVFAGEPTGIDYAVNPGNSADNARSMAQTAYYVANFRQNCQAPPAPTATTQATATHTPKPSATATATTTHTATPQPSATATATTAHTATPQPSATNTAVPGKPASPTPTNTAGPGKPASPTATNTTEPAKPASPTPTSTTEAGQPASPTATTPAQDPTPYQGTATPRSAHWIVLPFIIGRSD